MKKKVDEHKSHFIPSPFSVVTSYENAFIKKFNDNVADAVAEVLKYMAHATASAVKELEETKKAEDVSIEKAHKIGDEKVYQGITYYVGGFNAKGVPLWRKKKDSGTKKIELWKPRSEFAKCKTPKECVDILVQKDVVYDISSLDKCDLETAKKVASTLLSCSEQFSMAKIEVRVRKLRRGTRAQAGGGTLLELNENTFKNFDDDKIYKEDVIDYQKNRERDYKRLVEKKDYLKKTGQWDATRGKQLDDKIKRAKYAAEKYKGWTVTHKGSGCADIIIHELGHILNAQCTAGCGMMKCWESEAAYLTIFPQAKGFPKGTQEFLTKRIPIAKKLNQEHYNLWADWRKGDKLISEYGTTKRVEGFAEMFVAYVHGDTELPKNIHDYYDKYFKDTKPFKPYVDKIFKQSKTI